MQNYSKTGANSNTFAIRLIEMCGGKGPGFFDLPGAYGNDYAGPIRWGPRPLKH